MSMVDRLPQPKWSFGRSILKGQYAGTRSLLKDEARKRSRRSGRLSTSEVARLLEIESDPPCQPAEDVVLLPKLSIGLGERIRRRQLSHA